MALLSGCQNDKGNLKNTPGTTPLPDNAQAVISNTDPSALKMHDIAGALFFYYAMNKHFPEKIEAAFAVGDVPLDMNVPGGHGQYIYTPDGFLLQDRKSRIVVFEPAPLHDGYRLAITIADPEGNQPMLAKVIALPESFFLLRPPVPVDPAIPTPR
ncbi:MAG: hypothetical protein QM754_21235 [Tepidisphaeraceae bacterium]